MKKLILTSICALATVGTVFAQGNVRFDTIPFNAMTAQTNATAYSPLMGGGAAVGGTIGATATPANGGSFYYALLYTSGTPAPAPTTLAEIGAWTAAGPTATNASVAGRLTPSNPNAGFQVPWSPGTTQSIMMVGWSANLGTTWASALANLQNASYLSGLTTQAFFGRSAIGFITTLSTATSPGATLFGTAVTAQGTPINSVNTQLYLVPVAAVPEPATLVLAGLGGIALLGLRRKK